MLVLDVRWHLPRLGSTENWVLSVLDPIGYVTREKLRVELQILFCLIELLVIKQFFFFNNGIPILNSVSRVFY